MATFYGTATALDADTAQDLALEQARSAAFDTLGTSIEFTSYNQVYVKANNDGTSQADFQDFTWTASYQVQAVQVDTPPPEDTIDTTGLDEGDQIPDGNINTGPTNVNDTYWPGCRRSNSNKSSC